MPHYGHLTTYYLVAFFIPNKFPTLLAEREIIANAYIFIGISPPNQSQRYNKKQKSKPMGQKNFIKT